MPFMLIILLTLFAGTIKPLPWHIRVMLPPSIDALLPPYKLHVAEDKNKIIGTLRSKLVALLVVDEVVCAPVALTRA